MTLVIVGGGSRGVPPIRVSFSVQWISLVTRCLILSEMGCSILWQSQWSEGSLSWDLVYPSPESEEKLLSSFVFILLLENCHSAQTAVLMPLPAYFQAFMQRRPALLYASFGWAPVLPLGRTQNEAVYLSWVEGHGAAQTGPFSVPNSGVCWSGVCSSGTWSWGCLSGQGDKGDADQPLWLPSMGFSTCTLLCKTWFVLRYQTFYGLGHRCI